MEPITFELRDGYQDPQTKKIYKHVVMRQLTMRDQKEIKADTRINDILASSYSLKSENGVEQLMALNALQEYHLIVFSKIVESIGDLKRSDLLKAKVFESLSTRDVMLMMEKHMGSNSQVVPIDLVFKVIDEKVPSDELRDDLRSTIQKRMGESSLAINE